MSQLFSTEIQRFQFMDKYARFDPETKRRETWEQTITRVAEYLREISDNLLPEQTYTDIYNAIHDGRVMPSMRLLAMAGKAARRANNVIYNCAYVTMDRLSTWSEMLTVSMGGSGCGYSVESRYVDQLPRVKVRVAGDTARNYTVEDSSKGWADALQFGVDTWYAGEDALFDLSNIRPKGAILKTKGGRASGPEPLRELLNFTRRTILGAAGRKLTPLECHDIATKVGDCVVQGGVRRSALICLFDADDIEMIKCKDAAHIEGNYHRYNANNSAVWNGYRTRSEIAEHMYAMHKDGNGEPGIFSRFAAKRNAPHRRDIDEFGTNPCAEIVLRPRQFCNLTTAVARAHDTEETLAEKVAIATVIGTIQSAATYFPDLPEEWSKNCQDERLLGVDINGQLDCPLFARGEETGVMLRHLRDVAISTNQVTASAIGINPSKAITCVKPSGNSSTLLDCSPGIHPRHSRHYIRRARISADGAMYWAFYMSGWSLSPENGQGGMENPTTYVVEFPVEAPETAIVKSERGAIEQLDYWLLIKKNWTEHNPSCTITYRPEEIEDMISWLYTHQADVNGLSFLPASDMMYEQAPYEEISRERYNEMSSKLPALNFDYVHAFDDGADNTSSAQTLACFAGSCDII